MTLRFDAIFENGALRPLPPVSLTEGERVRLTVAPVNATAPSSSPDELLELARGVYEGFTPQDVEEIEAIITRRRDFLSRKLE